MIGAKHEIEKQNKRFGPTQSTILAVKNASNKPAIIPNTASHEPIEGGVNPRPPR
jgi:hypothetical protein